jgi:hypothetical protein
MRVQRVGIRSAELASREWNIENKFAVEKRPMVPWPASLMEHGLKLIFCRFDMGPKLSTTEA